MTSEPQISPTPHYPKPSLARGSQGAAVGDSLKRRLGYHQQLRDPRWLRLALALKEEHGWCCEHCKRPQGQVELSIHHTFYVTGLMMWEHPRCLLMCLCSECHKRRQEIEQTIYVNVADVMRDKTNEELLVQPISSFFTEGFTL